MGHDDCVHDWARAAKLGLRRYRLRVSTSDWLGIAGLVVGIVGVVVSGGSWIWAVRANRTAARAETQARGAKDAVESLVDRFEREATQEAELLVYRIGPGVNIINKSNNLMRSVAVGPADGFRWDDLAEVGDLPALSAGAANVGDKYSDWGAASRAFVYWLTETHHRRVNTFPIVDADPAAIAGALGGVSDGTP